MRSNATRILTVEEMSAADALATRGQTDMTSLMEAAGKAVAKAVAARAGGRQVLVLCGPGNNGGDGFVAARHLQDMGFAVRVFASAPSPSARPEAAAARDGWAGEVKSLQHLLEAPEILDRNRSMIIDALFGAGLSAPLTGIYAEIIRHSETAEIIAVDVPSGLPGNIGRPRGPCVNAKATVTFAAPKPAHLLCPGRELCGDLTVADIGIGRAIIEQVAGDLWHNSPALWSDTLPHPTRRSHKHSRGRLSVVAGPPSSTGAARLAARAGLRIGAGLVTLRCKPASTLVLATHSEAVMVKAFADTDSFRTTTEGDDALVIGPACGINGSTRALTLAWLQSGRPAVLDADSLSVFQDAREELFDALHSNVVLTPHTGEFERLFPGLIETSASDLEAVRSAASLSGAVVLLKGATTVIGDPSGRAVLNTHASPYLATAGSGDVLAGMIGGLLAQGMEPLMAASAAAWLHGDVGVRLGVGLISEDLPDALPESLRRLL